MSFKNRNIQFSFHNGWLMRNENLPVLGKDFNFHLKDFRANSPTFKTPLPLKTNERLKKLFAKIHISCWQQLYKIGAKYLSPRVFYPNGCFDSRGSKPGGAQKIKIFLLQQSPIHSNCCIEKQNIFCATIFCKPFR